MLIPSHNRPPLLPPKATAIKLFTVGATLGPIVDSLHNQCLLSYDFAPITVSPPPVFADSSASGFTATPLFCSSWAVPPLLGIAYIVLGYILPRIIEVSARNVNTQYSFGSASGDVSTSDKNVVTTEDKRVLQTRAILAVSSTAAIIKLSEFLETHAGMTYHFNNHSFNLDANTNLIIMLLADVLQWISLDRTVIALLAAAVTAVGGPLSELPFVANGFWHYNVDAADYFPLSGTFFESGGIADGIASSLFGEGYSDLALSSITGPCYFAVTLDAIALGRYFDKRTEE
ncbi:hypothetical protein HJC23_007843 [Cyclotella cryptica]|uniref:Uncharacterized protein n=1 Tax=Cyclotella cryptica TaxID=29204 RepID=A0ABD3R0X3_9STRA|eukprot:CCRYP_000150-RA/>CCRYP_000150-RA protein AED:0.38 eAED:0.38 QI:0/-1/0/1/-1/1/1/0/287